MTLMTRGLIVVHIKGLGLIGAPQAGKNSSNLKNLLLGNYCLELNRLIIQTPQDMHYQSCKNLKDQLKNKFRVLVSKFSHIQCYIYGQFIFSTSSQNCLAQFRSNLLCMTFMTRAVIIVQIKGLNPQGLHKGSKFIFSTSPLKLPSQFLPHLVCMLLSELLK